MKFPFHLLPYGFVSMMLMASGVQISAAAPAAKRVLLTIPSATTNTVPLSVFVVPKNDEEGRDPFFPKSDRLKRAGTAKKVATPKAPALTLVYNGLSGTSDRQLAIINGRTLAEGEETELVVGTTRVKIRCLEIKGETVIVEFLGERRELRLRVGK